MARSQFINVNGMRLHLLTAGDPDAPPVLLLHGGGIDGALVSWRYLIPSLAHTHRVYALDFPGYGHSDAPPEDVRYTTPYLVETTRAVLHALNLSDVALVGLSMGGAAALGAALAERERVRRLVLVGCYGLQDHAPLHQLSLLALSVPAFFQRIAWALVRRVPLARRLGLSAIYRNPLRLTSETLADAAESVSLEYFYEWLRTEITPGGTRTNYTPQLASLEIPVLLVHGQHDPSIPLHWAARAARQLPNGQLAVIPHCGHWVTREQPTAFAAVALPFLAGLPPSQD